MTRSEALTEWAGSYLRTLIEDEDASGVTDYHERQHSWRFFLAGLHEDGLVTADQMRQWAPPRACLAPAMRAAMRATRAGTRAVPA